MASTLHMSMGTANGERKNSRNDDEERGYQHWKLWAESLKMKFRVVEIVVFWGTTKERVDKGVTDSSL
jgi:hypothetical protein